MPRTKSVKPNINKANSLTKKQIGELVRYCEEKAKALELQIRREHMDFSQKINAEFTKLSMDCGGGFLRKKKIAELIDLPNDYLETNSMASVLMTSTKTRKQLVRSSSFNDDGYLTADSNGSSAAGRSRSKVKTTIKSNQRSSRSLSARKIPKKPAPMVNSMSTTKSARTNNRANTYGVITPKVVPNTPQVVLRRPMHGEMALSLKGSPLYTGQVPTETEPNVNIPLNDGRLLSLQPQRGLRVSQVPQLDEQTKLQLMQLRENLDKLCSISKTKKFN